MLFLQNVNSLLVYNPQTLFDCRLSNQYSGVYKTRGWTKNIATAILRLPAQLFRIPVLHMVVEMVKSQGLSSVWLYCPSGCAWVRLSPTSFQVLAGAVPQLSIGYRRPGADPTRPPLFSLNGADLLNLPYVARATRSDNHRAPDKFVLVNTRSLSKKTFIFKDYVDDSDFLCITDTWATACESSALAELSSRYKYCAHQAEVKELLLSTEVGTGVSFTAKGFSQL